MSKLRSDYHYHLPEELIAAHPAAERTASRLLVWDPVTQTHTHKIFADLVDLVSPDDLLVFNNTRVQRARLLGHKASGGAVEVLVERLWPDGSATAMIRASKAPKVDAMIRVGEDTLQVCAVDKPVYRVRGVSADLSTLMARHGHMPLPPYIRRPDNDQDGERYQTVYAQQLGSAAAPTAGLHFDERLIEQLREVSVRTAQLTLHVGLGTFAPVRVDDLREHEMHAEWFDVPESVVAAIAETRARGGRVISVGTTTLRALETAAQCSLSADGELMPYSGESRLFVSPGYAFQVVDALITNFHLPESTLLMLVSAFAGFAQTQATYRLAVEAQYRFFSFGDAMFITRRQEAVTQ
jgi:S-adenosylmethionine:tRNA ribosyltransferase-isomerase